MTTAHQILILFVHGFSCLGFLSNCLKQDKGFENERYELNRSDDMRNIRELLGKKCRRLRSSCSFGNETPEILGEDFFSINCRFAQKDIHVASLRKILLPICLIKLKKIN